MLMISGSSAGFCLGSHLALRAALDGRIKAAVCCYPTGLQNGVLGADRADTLEQLDVLVRRCSPCSAASIVPPEALQQVLAAFDAGGLDHRSAFEADHTFMRGPRWDPQAADQAWSAAMQFLADRLQERQIGELVGIHVVSQQGAPTVEVTSAGKKRRAFMASSEISSSWRLLLRIELLVIEHRQYPGLIGEQQIRQLEGSGSLRSRAMGRRVTPSVCLQQAQCRPCAQQMAAGHLNFS